MSILQDRLCSIFNSERKSKLGKDNLAYLIHAIVHANDLKQCYRILAHLKLAK